MTRKISAESWKVVVFEIPLWRNNRATNLCPVIIRARLLCDLSSKFDAEKLIQLEDYRVKIIFV